MISELELNTHDMEIFRNYKERPFNCHSKAITTIAWNPLGSKLASTDTNIKLWNLDESTGLTRAKELKCTDSTIQCMDWCDNNTLFCVGKDAFKFWDIRESKAMAPLRIDKKSKIQFTRAAWSAESQQWAVGNKENVIGFYDRRNNSLLDSLKLPFDIADFLWDRTDSVFLVAGQTGELHIHENSKSHPEQARIPLHSTKITTLTIDPTNRYLLSAAQDALIQLIDLEQFIVEKCFHKTDGIIDQLSFSYNSRFIAATCDQPYVDIYNVENGVHSYRFETLNPQGYVRWHPKKMMFAVIDADDKSKKGQSSQQQYTIRLYAP